MLRNPTRLLVVQHEGSPDEFGNLVETVRGEFPQHFFRVSVPLEIFHECFSYLIQERGPFLEEPDILFTEDGTIRIVLRGSFRIPSTRWSPGSVALFLLSKRPDAPQLPPLILVHTRACQNRVCDPVCPVWESLRMGIECEEVIGFSEKGFLNYLGDKTDYLVQRDEISKEGSIFITSKKVKSFSALPESSSIIIAGSESDPFPAWELKEAFGQGLRLCSSSMLIFSSGRIMRQTEDCDGLRIDRREKTQVWTLDSCGESVRPSVSVEDLLMGGV